MYWKTCEKLYLDPNLISFGLSVQCIRIILTIHKINLFMTFAENIFSMKKKECHNICAFTWAAVFNTCFHKFQKSITCKMMKNNSFHIFMFSARTFSSDKNFNLLVFHVLNTKLNKLKKKPIYTKYTCREKPKHFRNNV